MRFLVSINNWFESACKLCVITLMGTILIIVNVEILLRTTVGYSMPWVSESSKYMLYWITFSGAVISFRNNDHPVISTFLDLTKGPLRKACDAFILTVSLVIMCSLLYYGWHFSETGKYMHMSSLTSLTMQWVYLAMPVGSLLSICMIIEKLIALVAPKYIQSKEMKESL